MTADLDRDELRALLTEASAGLNEREREVLDLHMRHELEGEELADALGVSVQNAYKLVQRVRDRVERSLGSLLVARHGRRCMLRLLLLLPRLRQCRIKPRLQLRHYLHTRLLR